jgi:hypothetical protein
MRDPELQDDPNEFCYYVPNAGPLSDWSKRTPVELIGDVNKLHTFTRQLVVEKERLQREATKNERRLDSQAIKIWLLLLFLAAEGSAIGLLFKMVMSARVGQ